MKVQVSHRLDEGLLAWATEYGESRKTSRAVVIEEALRHFQALTRGGVPDLPVPDTPEVRKVRAASAAATEVHRAAAAEARAELIRNIGERQRKLNEAKYGKGVS